MKARRSTKTGKSTSAKKARNGKRTRNRESIFPVVGIGASAGGLDSFERLLKHLPTNTGMAFVVVQHLDPTHESQLPQILTRATKMPVIEAREGMRVEADKIYVIPPDKDMFIREQVLHLEPRRTSEAPHMPVDIFFRSLAADHKNKAVGVILSGTATDGTVGLKAIKTEGGITFAQDSASAKYSGMPRSAIAAGAVDLVLPPEEIARHLSRLGDHPYIQSARVEGRSPKIEQENPISQLFRLLKKSFGVDFAGYKFSTIERRIKRRMALQGAVNFDDYLQRVRKNPGELRALFQDMFIGVTEFFRDPGLFSALVRSVYPAILKNRSADSPIRIWVPGCSTGEEVYSIAISLLEYAGTRADNIPIQIFGTDVNEEAIKKARVGQYGNHITANVSVARLRRFFIKTDSGFQVSKKVRDVCVFAKHDVVQDPPFTRLDLLSCRNLLIYLDGGSQRKLIPILHYSLKPSGFLILGSAETMVGSFNELFSLRDRKHKIYAKKVVSHRFHFELPVERAPEALHAETDAKPFLLRSDFDLQKEAADRLILNHYGPAAVLVNRNMDILHFRGHTGLYLEPASGVASLNLLKMAREGLLQGLRTSLDDARKKNAAVTRRGLHVEFDGQERVVDIHIAPIKTPGTKERAFLVLFDDKTPKTRTAKRALPRSSKSAQEGDLRTAQLKQELVATKAYLQSVIESQEVTNEELRSLNEEVVSSNEELKSTTEELETSNEELQ
jgi:two-component system, chemotaxis family, CheB/CheR fusion protein